MFGLESLLLGSWLWIVLVGHKWCLSASISWCYLGLICIGL